MKIFVAFLLINFENSNVFPSGVDFECIYIYFLFCRILVIYGGYIFGPLQQKAKAACKPNLKTKLNLNHVFVAMSPTCKLKEIYDISHFLTLINVRCDT